MTKKYTTWVFIILSGALLSSCRARFYTPNRNPVPFFEERGDLYLDGSTNIALNKYDLTAGCAITNGLGAYIGYSGAKVSGNIDSMEFSKYRYSGNMLNLGFGYFLNSNISENLRFEVYGDYGKGNYRNSTSGGRDEYLNGDYERIGLLGNIGYSGENFTLAYSARLSQLTFKNARYSGSDSGFWENALKRLNSKSYYNLLEHAVQFRFGFEHVKFYGQLAAYHAFNANGDDNAIPYFTPSVMVGVILKINPFGGGDD